MNPSKTKDFVHPLLKAVDHGEKSDSNGDNAFFYKMARRSSTFAIDLLRHVTHGYGTTLDLVRLLSEPSIGRNYVLQGKARLRGLHQEISMESDEQLRLQMTGKEDNLKEAIHFFDTEWNQMDVKMKTGLLNILNNAYVLYSMDERARKYAC
jgi:hypothetical protein